MIILYFVSVRNLQNVCSIFPISFLQILSPDLFGIRSHLELFCLFVDLLVG